MKKIIILLLLLVVKSATAMEIVELKLPKSDLVVIKLQFKAGSVNDPGSRSGICMLTASLLAEGGTTKLTSTAVQDSLYPMAANVDVSVDKEVTIFTMEVHRELLNRFYPIVKDLLLNPRFDTEDFERIKSNQLNYVEQVIRNSDDEEYGKKLLENFMFAGSPYAYLVAGSATDVKAITVDDCKRFYNNFFAQANLTIGIAGNYPADFAEKLKADFSKLNASAPEAVKPLVKAVHPQGLDIKIIGKDNALGSAISMGFPLDITRRSDDFIALMVANSWLGEHRKGYSRLYQKIREQRSMNYGDYSYIEWYQNGGQNMLPRPGYPRSSNYFSIWIRPVQTAKGLKGQYQELKDIEIGHAHFAIRMALYEMYQLLAGGMTKEDFELTRQFLRSYIKLYAQTPEQKLGYLLDSKFYGRNDWLADADRLLGELTLEKVNAAMNKYWQTNNMHIVIVTDRSETVPLARSLRDNLPSPMSYSNALKSVLNEQILQQDKLVEQWMLKDTKVEILESDGMFR